MNTTKPQFEDHQGTAQNGLNFEVISIASNGMYYYSTYLGKKKCLLMIEVV